MTRFRWVALGLIVLAVGAYLILGRTAGTNSGGARAVPVTVTKPLQQDVPIYINAVGNVQANNSVLVRVRVDGEVKRIAFEEGQFVKAGDLLAEIDSRALRAELEVAEAQKAKDESAVINARRDLNRIANLAEREFASRQSIDTQRALVAQLEAQLKGDLAKIESAKVQLSFTRITAPISGRLGARLIDQGNIVRAADATGLVTIKQVDPAIVAFSLPESAYASVVAAQVKSTNPLRVTAMRRDSNSMPIGPAIEGEVQLVNNEIDQTTGTLLLKARFANRDHALWPGQFVNTNLILEVRPAALTVPSSAVQNGPDGPFVFLVDQDGKAAMRRVSVGQNRDGLAIIEKGLSLEDVVVVDGQYRLRPGIVVSATQSGAAS
jgi:multidrug efflux system membrane fusion protein